MTIKKVSIIGLGALGVLFGHHLAKQKADLTIIADQARIERYQKDGVYSNGEKCEFRYITPQQAAEPTDLLIFAVKFNQLNDAIEDSRGVVGENTVILSLLNGITSEEIIGQAFGIERVVYCVAEQMDAVKTGNRLTYKHMGQLSFGDFEPGIVSEKVHAVDEFFKATGIAHSIETQMQRKLWGKFMVNVGANQVIAAYAENYSGIQQPGECRDLLIAAMREVMALSEKEGIHLNAKDLEYWLNVLDGINPLGKPSMRQDVEARRPSELELFAGTVLRLSEKHGLKAPVNAMLYEKIKEIESQY